MIVTEMAQRHPAQFFGRRIDRAYAFPRTARQTRISYRYAIFGTALFFFPALMLLGRCTGESCEPDDVAVAAFVLVLGYPGVVNLPAPASD